MEQLVTPTSTARYTIYGSPLFTMSQPQIQITLKLGQPLKVEVLNERGSSCTKLTEALHKLGETSATLKPEYYEEPCQQVSDRVNIGD